MLIAAGTSINSGVGIIGGDTAAGVTTGGSITVSENTTAMGDVIIPHHKKRRMQILQALKSVQN
jgi:hypothetical protein